MQLAKSPRNMGSIIINLIFVGHSSIHTHMQVTPIGYANNNKIIMESDFLSKIAWVKKEDIFIMNVVLHLVY